MKNSMSMFALLVIAFVLSQSVKIIPEGRTGVIFNRVEGIQKTALGEGIHFLIPLVQELIQFDTRIKTYSLSDIDSGEIKLGNPIEAKTKDGQKVYMEVSIISQMIQERAPEIYKELRFNFKNTLKKKISKVMLEVIARYEADALYTQEIRKAVTAEVFGLVSKSFLDSGFELKEVLLRRIDFTPEYIDAIENKQIALQKAQLAQIRKDIAIKEKEIEIIKGEAKAKEVEIKGRAIQVNPRVAELQYLETIEQSNKKIPVIMGLKGNNFINLDRVLQ